MTEYAPQHIDRRDIPIPGSVSPQAQAMLARGPLGARIQWPRLDDTESWLRVVAMMDAGARAMMDDVPGLARGSRDAIDLVGTEHFGSAIAYVFTPPGLDSADPRAVMHIHGGAWIQGGGDLCRAATPARANAVGVRTWSVDYRMPPLHPFPAGLDDAIEVYRGLLEHREAGDIVVMGDSAGGNLAAGLILRLRDEGLPLPAGLVLDTPATDLTGASDSLHANDGLDPVLVGDFRATMGLYAGDADLRNPYVSPIYGDFTTGYPHTLLLTGTRDRLLSDTVRMHRALLNAGVPVDLHVFEAQGHGGFLVGAPEDLERAAVIRQFVNDRFEGAGSVLVDRAGGI